MLFFTATLTPFDTRGRVDLGRLRAHVLWLTAQGVDGFVPTGMSGELLYLGEREREAVHRTVLDAALGCLVYPCVWDPSPTTTAYLADAAREQGATGIILPPPLFYSLPGTLVADWYRDQAQRAQLPVLALRDPARGPSSLDDHLYSELLRDGVLAGLQDDTGDIFKVQRLARRDPSTVYTGDDGILPEARHLPELAGVISTAANTWPDLCLRIYRKGESQLEEAYRNRLAQVRAAGGLRALKAILAMGCRPPLTCPSPTELGGLPASEFPD